MTGWRRGATDASAIGHGSVRNMKRWTATKGAARDAWRRARTAGLRAGGRTDSPGKALLRRRRPARRARAAAVPTPGTSRTTSRPAPGRPGRRRSSSAPAPQRQRSTPGHRGRAETEAPDRPSLGRGAEQQTFGGDRGRDDDRADEHAGLSAVASQGRGDPLKEGEDERRADQEPHESPCALARKDLLPRARARRYGFVIACRQSCRGRW